MSKSKAIFLIATASMILFSFGVLCYLMRTVNPKQTNTPQQYKRYAPMDLEYFDETFLPSDNLEYGLEKVDIEDIEKQQYPRSIIHPILSIDSNNGVIPPIYPDINFSNLTNFSDHKTIYIQKSKVKGKRRSITDETGLNVLWKPMKTNHLVLNFVDYKGKPKLMLKLKSRMIDKGTDQGVSNNNNILVLDSKNNTVRYNETVQSMILKNSLILKIISNDVNKRNQNIKIQ